VLVSWPAFFFVNADIGKSEGEGKGEGLEKGWENMYIMSGGVVLSLDMAGWLAPISPELARRAGTTD